MPRKSPKGGRPTLLNPDVHKKLIEATKMGSPMSVAAAYVGITERTFGRWMQRGYDAQLLEDDDKPVPADDQPYLALFKEVSQARSQAAVMHVGLIQRAAQGGVVTEETTKKYRDPETGSVVEETTVKRTAPDWRAGAWYLERQHRQHFGRDKDVHMEISGPGGGPVEVVEVEAVANRVRENIAAAMEAARAQITAGPEEADTDPDIQDAEVLDDDTA
jgi:hypothetical protein